MEMGRHGNGYSWYIPWMATICSKQNQKRSHDWSCDVYETQKNQLNESKVVYLGILDRPPAFVTSVNPIDSKYDFALPLRPPDAQ